MISLNQMYEITILVPTKVRIFAPDIKIATRRARAANKKYSMERGFPCTLYSVAEYEEDKK